MSTLLVPRVDVEVLMTESGVSRTTIGTECLGPCFGFLLMFVFDQVNHAVLMHYTDSIQNKSKALGLVGQLALLLHFISTTTLEFVPVEKAVVGGQLRLSDMYLTVVGGDPTYGEYVRNALSMLNRKLDFPIAKVTEHVPTCLFYYGLLNRVTIFKSVSKMLPADYESAEDDADDQDGVHDDDDDNEVDVDDGDGEEIDDGDKVVEGMQDEIITDQNDYPSVALRYSAIDRNLSLLIEWSSTGCTGPIACLNMNMLVDYRTIKWEIMHNNITQFDQLCGNDELLRNRLYESVELISVNYPFVISPYHANSIQIGINGFGRIGLYVLQCALLSGISVMVVNDPCVSIDQMVNMLENDQEHQTFKGKVSYQSGKLVINGQEVAVFAERQPSDIPWSQLGAEYVVESTGTLTTIEQCQAHIDAGAKKVIITASSTDAPMFIIGVNHEKYTREETILSSGSCTINCLAHLAKVVHKKFDIDQALMMTVNSSVAAQDIDWSSECESRRSITASSTTSVAEAMKKVIPDFEGKVVGVAVRVPTPNVSVVDLTVQLKKKAKYLEICDAIKAAANGSLQGILAYTDDQVVPTDIIVNTYSSIFDAKAGVSYSDTLVKLVSWYKNEYGYSRLLVDLIKYIDFVKHAIAKIAFN